MKPTKPFYKVREIKDLRDLLNQSAELFGDKYAFEVKNKDGAHYNITFRSYRDDILAMGTALADMGLFGQRIAVCAENCYEWCVSYMSVVTGLGVVVPTDKDLQFDDINDILDTADIKLIFCDRKTLVKLNKNRDRLKKGLKFVCFKQADDTDEALSYDKLLTRGAELLKGGDKRFIDAKIDVEAMCTLLFTSGTTGLSKGVMLCHRNFCREVMSTMGVVKIQPEDCGISMLPLHHTYESTIILFMALYCGAKVTFCEGFKYVLQNMKEFNPSIFVSVPLVLEKVHNRIIKAIYAKPHGELKFKIGKFLCKVGQPFGIDFKKKFFGEIQETFGGHMRLIICGAAPINPQILEDFDAFGIQIIFGYGLTECAPLAIINNDRMHLSKSIGVPLPDVEVKILNPDPETHIGELAVKGPMVMLGYYNNPEATEEVIDSDGFLHTGDLGWVDRRGRYYLCGRSKNVIVTQNGKNIFPEELEYHLCKSPLIEECMVVGVEDNKGDLSVKARIYPNSEEIGEMLGSKDVPQDKIDEVVGEIVSSVNRELPSYKKIKSFSIRDRAFVKTTTEKIKRHMNDDEDERDVSRV